MKYLPNPPIRPKEPFRPPQELENVIWLELSERTHPIFNQVYFQSFVGTINHYNESLKYMEKWLLWVHKNFVHKDTIYRKFLEDMKDEMEWEDEWPETSTSHRLEWLEQEQEFSKSQIACLVDLALFLDDLKHVENNLEMLRDEAGRTVDHVASVLPAYYFSSSAPLKWSLEIQDSITRNILKINLLRTRYSTMMAVQKKSNKVLIECRKQLYGEPLKTLNLNEQPD